jgi:class 3 adenylate cyclase/TolB-like protein
MATGRVERRLAAILAADVVGYSRLMERDEDRTLERLKAHRKEFIEPLIAEYQGRVVKLMGDGVLVEFASVVDAARCAVLIQRGMAEREAEVPEDQRLRFRIGINLGDVIHEADGDLYGDGVNVAARLEQLAEPGGVVVSGTAYDHLQGKLDLPLEFAGEQRVKNIERLVRAYRVRLDGAAIRFGSRRIRRLGRWAVATALGLFLLVVAAAGGWWWRQAGEPAGPALPDKPSIVVLPFDNLTGDERLGRLADGMVENIIADLPRHGLFVIARGTSFAYRDKPHDARSIGRELGVRYVVEGSLQGDGERLRAIVNLVDATTGGQLWSERYDRPLDDLFAVQDELGQRIFNAIGGAFGATLRAATEAARRKPTESLQAYDLLLLAREERLRRTEEANTKAIELARRAIEIDPSSWLAHYSLAEAYADQVFAGWVSFDEAAGEWLAEATRAVELEPGSGWARLVLAWYYAAANDDARYMNELERAADLADGDALLMAMVAGELPWAGQTARGGVAGWCVAARPWIARPPPLAPGQRLFLRASVRGGGVSGRGLDRVGRRRAGQAHHDLRPARPACRPGALALPPTERGTRFLDGTPVRHHLLLHSGRGGRAGAGAGERRQGGAADVRHARAARREARDAAHGRVRGEAGQGGRPQDVGRPGRGGRTTPRARGLPASYGPLRTPKPRAGGREPSSDTGIFC